MKTCADFSAGPPRQADVLPTASPAPVAPCGQTSSGSAADQLRIYSKAITRRTKAFTALSCKEVTEQDSATGKGLHTREFEVEHR